MTLVATLLPRYVGSASTQRTRSRSGRIVLAGSFLLARQRVPYFDFDAQEHIGRLASLGFYFADAHTA